MIYNNPKYTYKDVFIIPEFITNINSRSNVDPFYKVGKSEYLPIFTAPMSCVINVDNYLEFSENNILGILPTTIDIDERLTRFSCGYRTSFSINEIRSYILKDKFLKGLSKNVSRFICIDCANGHMNKLIDLCKELKSKFEEHDINIEIMTGNIANPNVIKYYLEAGIDYVRCGIGGGSGCITTSNVGIHFPMASLINECREELRKQYLKHGDSHKLKIVADGGIRNYDDVIKALALGADYVMIGGLFTECIEAASHLYVYDQTNDKYCRLFKQEDNSVLESVLSEDIFKNFYHEVYGMSTKRAQKERGYTNLKTSEGTQHFVKIKYTLNKWTDNTESYLRSAMSYTNCKTLEEFTSGDVQLIISQSAQNVVNK